VTSTFFCGFPYNLNGIAMRSLPRKRAQPDSLSSSPTCLAFLWCEIVWGGTVRVNRVFLLGYSLADQCSYGLGLESRGSSASGMSRYESTRLLSVSVYHWRFRFPENCAFKIEPDASASDEKYTLGEPPRRVFDLWNEFSGRYDGATRANITPTGSGSGDR
jgi:hypothetical protein